MAELVDVADPAWPQLVAAIESAQVPTSVLPGDGDAGRRCLFRLQVSARSTLGAVALNTGGILVDHGWLRLLGAGADGLLDLATVNHVEDAWPHEAPPPLLLCAFDVLGGRFAIDGGGIVSPSGEVHYWGPDTLSWTGLGAGYSAFVQWALSGALADFYSDLRWAGWTKDVAEIRLSDGFMLYPPPCSVEGRDVQRVSRRPVPWGERSTGSRRWPSPPREHRSRFE